MSKHVAVQRTTYVCDAKISLHTIVVRVQCCLSCIYSLSVWHFQTILCGCLSTLRPNNKLQTSVQCSRRFTFNVAEHRTTFLHTTHFLLHFSVKYHRHPTFPNTNLIFPTKRRTTSSSRNTSIKFVIHNNFTSDQTESISCVCVSQSRVHSPCQASTLINFTYWHFWQLWVNIWSYSFTTTSRHILNLMCVQTARAAMK